MISGHMLTIGASIFGIFGAIGLILFEHFMQEKRNRIMAQNQSRMNAQICEMKAELEQFRKAQKTRRRDTESSRKSVTTSSTKSNYFTCSEVDTSDLEYFDSSDGEHDEISTKSPLHLVLQNIDQQLQNGDVELIAKTLTVLENLCLEYPDNADLWYRLAKGCHFAMVRAFTPKTKMEFISRGADTCLKAIELESDNPEFHKLYAILVGLRCDFEPTKQRIADGYLFKKHVDIAIRLNPNDSSLHQMLGRFKYEIAGLKWYERTVATALFGELPTASYEDALACFLKAERLSKEDWKENKMFIGKCYIALGNIRKGIDWLQQAYEITTEPQVEGRNLNMEIGQLLNKYQVSR